VLNFRCWATSSLFSIPSGSAILFLDPQAIKNERSSHQVNLGMVSFLNQAAVDLPHNFA
jgi:hypothetical protein